MNGERDRPGTLRGRIRSVTDGPHVPEAIQWQEGMLLAPQHFQQLARRQEELLAYQTGLAQPYAWGVRRLRLDPDALARGWFRVAELEAILPDGLLATLPEEPPLEMDLSTRKEALESARGAPVYLAVRRQRSDSVSVVGEEGRYRAVAGDPVVDENTGEGEQRLRRLRPRLLLRATDEPSGDHVRLPLARVSCRDNQYRLVPYEPPCLAAPAESKLGEIVADLAARLWAKAKYLAESRNAQRLETRMKIQALVSGLPLLEETLYGESPHPRQLYLALCAVAGPLGILRDVPLPPELPRYDHTDLLATFQGADRVLTAVLEEGVSEQYLDYVFELEKQRNVFYLFFEPAWQNRNLVLGVRRRAGQSDREIQEWMSEALIGSQSFVNEMQKSRILGISRRQTDSAGDLSTSSSVTLYEINPDSKYLKPGERLLVFQPRADELRPEEIVLYVENRERS